LEAIPHPYRKSFGSEKAVQEAENTLFLDLGSELGSLAGVPASCPTCMPDHKEQESG
jgi:hypothetical protein